MKVLQNGEDVSGKVPKKLPRIGEEFCSHDFWKALRCEFLATLIYVFLGCGSCLEWELELEEEQQKTSKETGERYTTHFPSHIQIALAFGFAGATVSQCVGHISGAHFNPAVTVAMLVTRRISILRGCCYWLVQTLGALAGAAILYGVSPLKVHGCLGCTDVHSYVGLGQAFGVEFMITFVVVFTVFANMEPKRADMGSRSLSIGLAIILGHLFGYQYTGASMNPVRSLAPAILTNHWHNHWVYWLGPMLGGILGGFTFEYTQDSPSNQIQRLRRSFRRRPKSLATPRSRSPSQMSINSAATEMTYSPTAPGEDFRI